jgi:hypothetical protein
MAVLLWTVVPLAVAHLLMWWRFRRLLAFQLLLDLGLAAVLGPALVSGGDLNPVRCLQNTSPFTAWSWAESTELQPSQSDLTLQFHPWWAETRRLLLDGELPLISERIGGGMPLLANGQTGVWAPVMLPVWALGPERGTTVMAFWKIEAAAVGAFLLLLCGWRLRWGGAAVAGLAYGCGAYQVGWVLVPLSWATAAMPWLWWGVHCALRRGAGWRQVSLIGALCGWLLGSGLHPETSAIVIGSAWLAGLVLHPRRWYRIAAMASVAMIATVALAWPTLSYIGSSSKNAHLASVKPNLQPLPQEIRLAAVQQLLIPAVHGQPGSSEWKAPYPYGQAAATGVGGVALALLAAGRIRRRYHRLLLAALASLVVAAVIAYRVPPLDWLLVRLPPIDRMTLPRFAALVPISLAIAAGVAADAVIRRRLRSAAWRLVPFAVLLAVALWSAPWALSGISHAKVWLTVGMAAAVALFARKHLWLAPAVAIEMSILAIGINPLADARDRLPEPPLLQELCQLVAREGGRVLGLHSAIGPNLASRYGLTDIRAFDPLRPAPYAQMMSRLGEQKPVLGRFVSSAPAKLCGAWSVRFLMTPPAAEVPGWQLITSDSSGALWRNPHWLPEVRLAGRVVPVDEASGWQLLTGATVDLATTAVIPEPGVEVAADHLRLVQLDASATQIAALISCDGPCLVVVARPWAPGWRATVDGEPAPLVRANLAGLGVVSPSGDHFIDLQYNPWLP